MLLILFVTLCASSTVRADPLFLIKRIRAQVLEFCTVGDETLILTANGDYRMANLSGAFQNLEGIPLGHSSLRVCQQTKSAVLLGGEKGLFRLAYGRPRATRVPGIPTGWEVHHIYKAPAAMLVEVGYQFQTALYSLRPEGTGTAGIVKGIPQGGFSVHYQAAKALLLGGEQPFASGLYRLAADGTGSASRVQGVPGTAQVTALRQTAGSLLVLPYYEIRKRLRRSSEIGAFDRGAQIRQEVFRLFEASVKRAFEEGFLADPLGATGVTIAIWSMLNGAFMVARDREYLVDKIGFEPEGFVAKALESYLQGLVAAARRIGDRDKAAAR